MIQFLRGGLVMACLVVTLFFLRSWRHSRERLFLAFAVAFVLFALNWALLALANPAREDGHLVFVFRALAFGVISAAIIDKNRTTKRS